MPAPHRPSACAACCWIPLFALRCEEARRPELASLPCALLSPEDPRRVWQVSSAARHAGVRPGLTVSQAIGLCPSLKLCEPDPVYYDEQFARLVVALSDVSPIVEPAELGRAFVGMDGLERLYGGPEEQVDKLLAALGGPALADGAPAALAPVPVRLGWGRGKFVAWVAATRARPGGAVIVPVGGEAAFLAAQALGVLPLDPDTHRRLRQLGLRTLRELVALPEEAVASQFGGAGRRLWRLAAGALAEPVVGRWAPAPIVVGLTFFSPVADREMLAHALDQLIGRALRHPGRAGWRVQQVRVLAELEHGSSWKIETVLKEPTAERSRIVAPLATRLAQSPPTKPVERLTVEFVSSVPGPAELQLFARDASAAARAGRRRALRQAVHEIELRLRRAMLFHVIEVQPWSRIPERRYALIDFEP